MTGNEVSSDPVGSAAQTADAAPSNDAPPADTSQAPVANTAAEIAAANTTTATVTAEELAQSAPAAAEQSSDAPSDSAPVASVAPAGVATASPKATAPTDVVQEPDTNLRTAETTDLSQPDATLAGSTEEEAEAEQQPAPRPEATQVAVLRADADGVVLVQPVAQQPQGKVVLDTISYILTVVRYSWQGVPGLMHAFWSISTTPQPGSLLPQPTAAGAADWRLWCPVSTRCALMR
ncbi:hypothetical protein [Pseudophaeobacter leonis]|uniref:hypothetical protein n=1 Tax=Pseudophaeobacter leonis TaxID=1144477 RepID=UPI0013747626|nr:hypothetical protein [Pseudophaeobacter leonis]